MLLRELAVTTIGHGNSRARDRPLVCLLMERHIEQKRSHWGERGYMGFKRLKRFGNYVVAKMLEIQESQLI